MGLETSLTCEYLIEKCQIQHESICGATKSDGWSTRRDYELNTEIHFKWQTLKVRCPCMKVHADCDCVDNAMMPSNISPATANNHNCGVHRMRHKKSITIATTTVCYQREQVFWQFSIHFILISLRKRIFLPVYWKWNALGWKFEAEVFLVITEDFRGDSFRHLFVHVERERVYRWRRRRRRRRKWQR